MNYNFTHINGQDSLLIVPIKIRFVRLTNLQQVQQTFLLQHSSAVCRNFQKLFFCHCEASLKRPDIFSMNFGWGGFCCIALIPDHPSWFGLADGLM